MPRKILVAGASGIVGAAAVAHFASLGDWDVVGVSRRLPIVQERRATYLSVDLMNGSECERVFGSMGDITDVMYAALNERDDDLIGGWRDPQQIEKNARMLENLFEPLSKVAEGLRHVVLIHGGKAYGTHIPGAEVHFPQREIHPRHAGDNFYHRQEDYIRAKQIGARWDWTILRPNSVVGFATGANMNPLLVMLVLASLRREAGLDLPAPSGRSSVNEFTDAGLVARATEWAMHEPRARDEIFNLTNGDVFRPHDMIPIIAKELGMTLSPPAIFDVREELDSLAHLWPEMVGKYGLNAPKDLGHLLGNSVQLTGGWSGGVAPGDELLWGLMSTNKIRKAGFGDCVDTADMIRDYIRRFKDSRIIPQS